MQSTFFSGNIFFSSQFNVDEMHGDFSFLGNPYSWEFSCNSTFPETVSPHHASSIALISFFPWLRQDAYDFLLEVVNNQLYSWLKMVPLNNMNISFPGTVIIWVLCLRSIINHRDSRSEMAGCLQSRVNLGYFVCLMVSVYDRINTLF